MNKFSKAILYILLVSTGINIYMPLLYAHRTLTDEDLCALEEMHHRIYNRREELEKFKFHIEYFKKKFWSYFESLIVVGSLSAFLGYYFNKIVHSRDIAGQTKKIIE